MSHLYIYLRVSGLDFPVLYVFGALLRAKKRKEPAGIFAVKKKKSGKCPIMNDVDAMRLTVCRLRRLDQSAGGVGVLRIRVVGVCVIFIA